MHRYIGYIFSGILVLAVTKENGQLDVFDVQFNAAEDNAQEELILARNTVCNPRVEVCE